MKIKKNGKVIRLTESDLKRIVESRLNEQDSDSSLPSCKEVMMDLAHEDGKKKNSENIPDKDGRIRIGSFGIAREEVTLHANDGGPNAGVVVAYKGGKRWCKC